MEERENLVYQAKLAEQAERYDGEAADTSNGHFLSASAALLRLSPCAGGSGDAGEAFTWISRVREDKMAEVFSAH